MNISGLVRLSGIAQKVPGMVYVGIFVALTLGSGVAALVSWSKHRGAAEATHRITLEARKDSLLAVLKHVAVLQRADSEATVQRAVTHAAVRSAQAVQRTRSHHVAVVNDTAVSIVTAAGSDSTVTVAPQIATALRDRDARIAADSAAIKADSTKIDTQAAKAESDSARVTLTTRIEDATTAITVDNGGGVSIGAVAKVVVVGAAVVGTAVEVVRFAGRFLHH